MISLYQLPYSLLVILMMMITVTLLLQTLCTVYGFYRYLYQSANLTENLLNTAVLIHLYILLIFVALTLYNVINSCIIVNNYDAARNLIFLILLLLSLMICVRTKQIMPLSIPIVASFTLPVTEQLTRQSFPLLFMASLLFWMFHSLSQLTFYRQEKNSSLTAFSIKEAVDTMDFGILFYKADHRNDGQVLLTNKKMQELMQTLCGKIMYNGDEFYHKLQNGDVLSDCHKDEMNSLPYYTLPDQTVWRFDLNHIRINRLRCALLTASDTTLRREATYRLYQQNRELEYRNRELREMLANLEQICRTEQTIHAKGRVHDLLGQRISVMLRSIREHKQPDQFLLESFAHGLPQELKKTSADPEYSLENLSRNFMGLGVSVHTEGDLPPVDRMRKVFYEIAAESMTNAVRHGYATEIRIRIHHQQDLWEMEITDNGMAVQDPVIEGGGLKSMRRKTLQMNGTFSYTTRPHFTITVRIPEGGIPCTTY